eukprot:scaffold8542_cov76-Skeletonema_dohrnii-CCMP3373.AAC.3
MSSNSAMPHDAQHMSAATKFSVLIFRRYCCGVLCHCHNNLTIYLRSNHPPGNGDQWSGNVSQ